MMKAMSALMVASMLAAGTEGSAAEDYFEIRVVDEATGRDVPLVELRTVHDVRYVTDSAGRVAFREPGLMGQRVFFHVSGHGYEFPKDGFGYRGRALDVKAGGSAVLKVRRVNVAQRLYRMTGAGIYRDSVLLGRDVPVKAPVLNGLVFGSDSVVNAVYRGKIYWFWGDTNRPGYPLGNFHVPGATSTLPKDGGLDPGKGVDLTYFVDQRGFAKETCRMPGAGPTWINGLIVLPDKTGKERLLAAYVKVRQNMETYQRGLVEWDDDAQQFRKVREFPLDTPAAPLGHPYVHGKGEEKYAYFGDPFPLVRCRATREAWEKVEDYEAYTCLKPGKAKGQWEVDRDGNGRARYAWRKGAKPLGAVAQDRFIRSGKLKQTEALIQLRDVDTGKTVVAHRGSVCWNAGIRRWLMIATQAGGDSSYLGEVWYAQAGSALGPWVYARKIVTHRKYSFYNPKQHPYFDPVGGKEGPAVYFEGTYTSTFSGSGDRTPRYNYNQIMYRLDLQDDRLRLPWAAYDNPDVRDGAIGFEIGSREFDVNTDGPLVAFFVPVGLPAKGLVSVTSRKTPGGYAIQPILPGLEDKYGGSEAPFSALPPTAKPTGAQALLWEYVSKDGRRRRYFTEDKLSLPGYTRTKLPVCVVWRSPWR